MTGDFGRCPKSVLLPWLGINLKGKKAACLPSRDESRGSSASLDSVTTRARRCLPCIVMLPRWNVKQQLAG